MSSVQTTSKAELVGADAIRAAASRLENVVVHTPLLPARWLADRVDGEVRLKCENLQLAGAFKLRGAYNAVANLPADVRARGVIAYSSGNHAQGVALAAKLFGVPAVVVMPTTSPQVKRRGAERLGAEIVLEGTTSVERQLRAEAIAAERGLAIIPAFDHPDIVAGQGTVGLEILADWPTVDAILVPVGGGGLLSGIAAWVKANRPGCRVIGVEPETADAMTRSVAAGHPVTIPPSSTIADGLMPVRPGDLTFAHASAQVDEMVRVSDAAIEAAARELVLAGKLVAEFSGAATMAALLSGAWRPAGQRTAVVVSGGNIEPSRLAQLVASA
jgi:threo-3-hydroxy-L-aspartate ammonia-lyase